MMKTIITEFVKATVVSAGTVVGMIGGLYIVSYVTSNYEVIRKEKKCKETKN